LSDRFYAPEHEVLIQRPVLVTCPQGLPDSVSNKTAKHAQNLAEWQLKCEALPPGARKLKKPVQLKRKDTPARFRGVSTRKKPTERHVVGESDEWDEDEGDEEANRVRNIC